jgi:hypothetical protein
VTNWSGRIRFLETKIVTDHVWPLSHLDIKVGISSKTADHYFCCMYVRRRGAGVKKNDFFPLTYKPSKIQKMNVISHSCNGKKYYFKLKLTIGKKISPAKFRQLYIYYEYPRGKIDICTIT